MRLSPEDAKYLGSRGVALEKLGDYARAWADFDAAVRIAPGDADHWEGRSRTADLLGREDEAEADFAEAERLRASIDETEGSDVMSGGEDRMALHRLVQEHFHNVPLEQIRLTTRFFPPRIWADLQLAADSLTENGRELVHFSAPQRAESPVGDFTELYQKDRRLPPRPAAPQYEEIDVGEDKPVACLRNGLWLLRAEGVNFAIVLNAFTQRGISFQVAAPTGPDGDRATADVFEHMEKAVRESRCYRGKVLSLELRDSYSGESPGIQVHRLRPVSRDEVVLPAATLELLDRNVIQFVRRRGRLKELGLSAKKGLLFYGPPGTGKTHTLHYLFRALEGHTTFLITAEQVGLLNDYMTLARLLQPSLVVIEDVDLIARERGTRGTGEEALLNKLLNEMDGLRPDAEVLFVLTTNHPEALEAALASRPGRIDQAVEFPLPDAAGRAKLVRLYAEKVELGEDVVRTIVARTDKVTASFIKELMRRAAQFALERDDSARVEPRDVDGALEELLTLGGSLNAKLLGAAGPFGFARDEPAAGRHHASWRP